MIGKIFHNIVNLFSPEVTQQAALETEKKERYEAPPGVDVAHRVLSEEAAQRRAELENLVRVGMPYVKRDNMKKHIRRTVWKIVGENFKTTDPDMIEEITESIINVVEIDPTYQKIFASSEESETKNA